MIKEAIEKILELDGPKVVGIADPDIPGLTRDYTERPLHQIKSPVPSPLKVSTLKGFCDYLNSGTDKVYPNFIPELVLIHGHDQVSAVTSLEIKGATRSTIIIGKCMDYDFSFAKAYDLESFIVGLQSCFVKTNTRDTLLSVVSALKIEKGATIKDDGVSQVVQTQSGVSRVANIALPNPVTLKPFRTFLDIDQPESEFIFRINETNGGVSCRLIEADGGAWKVTAVEAIKSYLKENIAHPELNLTIVS